MSKPLVFDVHLTTPDGGLYGSFRTPAGTSPRYAHGQTLVVRQKTEPALVDVLSVVHVGPGQRRAANGTIFAILECAGVPRGDRPQGMLPSWI